MWPIFAGAVVIHIGYKVLQAMAYTRGAYTVVYPVVRGTGPLHCDRGLCDFRRGIYPSAVAGRGGASVRYLRPSGL